MLKRVKKLVKGHKKIKEKNVNTLSFQVSDHSSGDCVEGPNQNKNNTITAPSFHITDHSSDTGQGRNKTRDKIIIPPSIHITDHSSSNDEGNNDDDKDNNNDNTNDNTDNRLVSTNHNKEFKNQRSASSGVLSEKSKSNKVSSKEKLFKKRKSSTQLQIPPEGLRQQVSKSTGDLTQLLSPNRHASQPCIKSTGDGSRRGSVGTVRENRLSVISKLDEYIDHFKKSVDEDRMAYAPNRLCCAQILLKVYQKREQQYIYNSLHHNKNSHQAPRRASHGQQHLLSPTSGSFHNLKNTSSTPDIAQGQHRRINGQQGSESSTSLSDDIKNCNFRIGGGCDTSDSDADSDGHEHNNNNSNVLDIDYSNNNRPGNSLGILKSNMRQGSMPLFPNKNQNIEIY